MTVLIAAPAVAKGDDSYRERAKALIGCAEVARAGQLQTASLLEQSGFIFALRYFESALMDDLSQAVPANLSRDQLSAFEMGRAYSEWIEQARRDLHKLGPYSDMASISLLELMDPEKEKARMSVALDEYKRRNCDLLLTPSF